MPATPRSVPDTAVLQWMVQQIEHYCHTHDIDHRFVGGISYGGLLNSTTTYDIDIPRRTVHLYKHNDLALIRPDRSVRDIDFIICTYEPRKYPDLKRHLNRLKWQVRLKLSYTPAVSYETVMPNSAPTHGLMNYVTSLKSDRDNYYLSLSPISHKISRQSIEPWHVVLTDGTTYTTRNPIADYYAYQFRSPAGIKPKDQAKIAHLKILSDEVIRQGKIHGIDFGSSEYYAPWKEYIHDLSTNTHPSIVLKRRLTKAYWSTIGTSLAHGRGVIGKPVFVLYNFFTRLTQ